ncbi:hypothetical protein [Microbacterium sp. 18062]|uniref:Sec-independent protein translocase subunit TatA/TatB n=1 Tax=Microbacterium sp. 18062 TaxID=2681410 RepID=UPI0013571994|nr:hypothetical protein [Microbacterium sp. 18062]
MFGLTAEKLVLVLIIAAVVIGPRRLPGYARTLADVVRSLRSTFEAARTQAEAETGIPLDRAQWQSLDPRRYDPRQIVRNALIEAPTASSAPAMSSAQDAGGADASSTTDAVTSEATSTDAEVSLSAASSSPSMTSPAMSEGGAAPSVPYRIVGSSAHPRRIRIPAEETGPGEDGSRASAPAASVPA